MPDTVVNITGPLTLILDDSFEANETLPTLIEEISLMERGTLAGAEDKTENRTEIELAGAQRTRREALNYLEHATSKNKE